MTCVVTCVVHKHSNKLSSVLYLVTIFSTVTQFSSSKFKGVMWGQT